jgi:hypothetical protein
MGSRLTLVPSSASLLQLGSLSQQMLSCTRLWAYHREYFFHFTGSSKCFLAWTFWRPNVMFMMAMPEALPLLTLIWKGCWISSSVTQCVSFGYLLYRFRTFVVFTHRLPVLTVCGPSDQLRAGFQRLDVNLKTHTKDQAPLNRSGLESDALPRVEWNRLLYQWRGRHHWLHRSKCGIGDWSDLESNFQGIVNAKYPSLVPEPHVLPEWW